MSLTLPTLDESGPVRDGARMLLNVYTRVVDVTDEIASTWAGLNTAYTAPETPDVLEAMTQPGTCARTLAADAGEVCAALLVYADRLDELKTVREQLATDITAHDTKTTTAATQSGDTTGQQHHQNLLHTEAMALEGRIAQLVQALEEAQQECSNTIHATHNGTTHTGGGAASLTGGGMGVPGLIPIEPDPRVWEINESRYGRFRSGETSQETGANGEALGLGEPVAGESAAMPRPEPWKYPGDSEGEGSGPYAQRGANLGDHATHEAAASAAGLMQPFWPDAARNLMHFLDNSGKPLDMNTNGMLKDLPSLQNNVNSDLNRMTSKAVDKAKTSGYTGPVTYPFVTEWQDEYAEKSENQNWFYATGGYQHATAGTITVYPDGSYTYKYQVHTADRYNWDGDKQTGIGPFTVTDKQLQELHRAGIAQEFDLVGESSVRTGP